MFTIYSQYLLINVSFTEMNQNLVDLIQDKSPKYNMYTKRKLPPQRKCLFQT